MMSSLLPRYKELLENSDAADATISDPLDLSVPTAAEAPRCRCVYANINP